MHTAAAVLYPQALATSITLPMEILQAASQLASVKKRGKAQVRVILAGRDRKQLRLASGVVLKPDRTLAELPPLDLLLLPAIWRNPLPAVAGWYTSARTIVLGGQFSRGRKAPGLA